MATVTYPQIVEMVNLYEIGYSTPYIARQFGVARSSVSKWLREIGVPMRKRTQTRHLLEVDIERTVFLYHNMDMSLRQTAEVLGLAQSTVNYRLHRAGRPPRTPRQNADRIIARRKALA